MSTAYHLHGNRLHETTDPRAHCRDARRRTLAVVGTIRGTIRRLEADLKAFKSDGCRCDLVAPCWACHRRTFEAAQ